MSFFKRLFGGDQPEPAAGGDESVPAADVQGDQPPERLAEDPYRGSLVAEVPRIATRAANKLEPIWDSWTDILAIELGDGTGFPVKSITYTGEGGDIYAVRKVTFVDDGLALDWQEKLATREFVSEHLTSRIGDRIVIPRATGVIARHVETGEPCWELPHPAKLYKQPRRTANGDLLLVFDDQSWIELAPRDGAFRAEGRIRSDDEADQLLDKAHELVAKSSEEAVYSGIELEARSDGLVVTGHRPVPRDRYEPPAPKIGVYPVDEWTPDDFADLVHDKLAVRLHKTWGNKTRMAVGLFEPTSLEPLRLLELGDFESSSDFRHGCIVDGLLLFYMDDLLVGGDTPYATFVIDTRAETVLACFIDDHESHLFDASGSRVWSGRL